MSIVTKMGSFTDEIRLGLRVGSLRLLGVGAAIMLLAGCSSLNIGEEEYSCQVCQTVCSVCLLGMFTPQPTMGMSLVR